MGKVIKSKSISERPRSMSQDQSQSVNQPGQLPESLRRPRRQDPARQLWRVTAIREGARFVFYVEATNQLDAQRRAFTIAQGYISSIHPVALDRWGLPRLAGTPSPPAGHTS